MSRVPWKDGKVVSFATRDGVYALGQMLISPYVMFFNAFHDSHDWPALDLASTPTLFCKGVVRQFTFKTDAKYLKYMQPAPLAEYPKRWISSHYGVVYRRIWKGTPREMVVAYMGDRGGKLVERDITAKGFEEYDKHFRVIDNRIELTDDATIDAHELDALEAHPYLNERLFLCRLFGRNVDPQKDLIFERPLPPEYERYLRTIEVSQDVLAKIKPGAVRD